MRRFDLRVYTLRTREALRFYADQVYPHHLNGLPLFNIDAGCVIA